MPSSPETTATIECLDVGPQSQPVQEESQLREQCQHERRQRKMRKHEDHRMLRNQITAMNMSTLNLILSSCERSTRQLGQILIHR